MAANTPLWFSSEEADPKHTLAAFTSSPGHRRDLCPTTPPANDFRSAAALAEEVAPAGQY